MKTNRILTMAQAISEGIAQEMTRDTNVFVMGEDVGSYGGIFGATGGLLDKFGKDRIMDTPISETAFIGAATGAAAAGLRPIVELMFVDFFGVCMDQIRHHHSHRRWLRRCGATLAVFVFNLRAHTWHQSGRSVKRLRCQGLDDSGNSRQQPSHFYVPQRHHGLTLDGLL